MKKWWILAGFHFEKPAYLYLLLNVKFCGHFFFSLLENQEQNTLSVKSFVKDKAIEMYARKGVENVKKQLLASEPFVVGSIDKEKIQEDGIE